MASQSERKRIEEFLARQEAVEKIERDIGAVDDDYTNAENRKKADEGLKNFARKTAPVIDENIEYKKEDPQLTALLVNEGLKRQRRDASDFLRANIETIVNEISPDNLEKLAATKEIVASSQPEARKTLQGYAQSSAVYRGLEEFVAYYSTENAVPRTEKEKEMVTAYAVNGALEEKRKELTEREETAKDAEAVAQIIALAIKTGNYDKNEIKRYALSGIAKDIEETKGKYKELRAQALELTKDTLMKLAKSDNGKEVRLGMELAKIAYKGEFQEAD